MHSLYLTFTAGSSRKSPISSPNRITLSKLSFCLGTRKSLSSVEESFLTAAENGDVALIKDILEDRQFNANFSDSLGRSPLRLAVYNEHLEVVKLLLERCNTTSQRETLLQAINKGNVQMVELVLKVSSHGFDTKEKRKFGENDYFFTQCQDDSQFSADITPLILAATRNQFQIVHMLLRRGETIAKPHHYYCHCRDCRNKLQFDQLRLAKTRLNAYRGLASEAYISLTSYDPILTAFKLAKELKRVAKIEKCYKTDYLLLVDQLSEFVVKLLDRVRGHDELEVILNKMGSSLDSTEESFELLGRFKLAIDYSEKKFVAHPSCQQKLVSIWYSNLRTLERANWFIRILLCLSITLLYPILTIIYWFAPKSKIANLLRCPCVKFIGRLVSFFTFLIMIIFVSLTTKDTRKLSSHDIVGNISMRYLQPNCTTGELCDFVVRQSKLETIEVLIALWIVGMFCQEVKEFYLRGFVCYFNSIFNYLDTGVVVLYMLSISLRMVCMMKTKHSLEYFSREEAWEALMERTSEKAKDAMLHLYWLIADRYYWEMHDPVNVSEATFAIANIVSFTRICYVFPANELLGPLQISLAKMAKDILKFMVIFLVLLMAFMVGLHNLYWYYPIETRKAYEIENHHIQTNAENYFGIHHLTFRTVFWATLGQGESSVVTLGNYNNTFTENVGYWIFGAYKVAIVIVLLNMLIAMMTRSFDTIQSEADTEWKFARSMLYMTYIKEDCTLPVPLNIFPSPQIFLEIYEFFREMLSRRPKTEEINYPGRIQDTEMFANHDVTSPLPQNKPFKTNVVLNPGIHHFRHKMATTLVRHDTDPNICGTLSYKRVMNRVIRRFMFDSQLAEDDDETRLEAFNFRQHVLHTLTETGRETTESIQNLSHKLDALSDAILYERRKRRERTKGDASTDPDCPTDEGNFPTERPHVRYRFSLA